jgi:hypothetical protein
MRGSTSTCATCVPASSYVWGLKKADAEGYLALHHALYTQVGLALFTLCSPELGLWVGTFHVLLHSQNTHQLMTAGIFHHVTNLTPGSDNPTRGWRPTWCGRCWRRTPRRQPRRTARTRILCTPPSKTGARWRLSTRCSRLTSGACSSRWGCTRLVLVLTLSLKAPGFNP